MEGLEPGVGEVPKYGLVDPMEAALAEAAIARAKREKEPDAMGRISIPVSGSGGPTSC